LAQGSKLLSSLPFKPLAFVLWAAMAEAAAPLPVVAAVAAPAGRGRGGAKKGRGKFKGKAKKKIVKVVPVGEDGLPLPKKEKALSLKTQVEQEIGDRDIEDVIKDARAKVEELQQAVTTAQGDEVSFETQIITGKTKMAEASAKVDTAVHAETLALEKLKAARRDLVEVQKRCAEKRLEASEGTKAFEVLEQESTTINQQAELMKEKEVALEAKAAAQKALLEAKLKEQEVAQRMKEKRQVLSLTDDPEAAERAKAEAVRAVAEEAARKEAKAAGANAEKDLKAELKNLEKMRADRDKERAKAFKEAAGLGPKKRAIADGGASPAKAAKIHDVD